MDSSSSERRDESEESRSGGTRDRLGRGGRQVARPSTPLHRPPPPSISPRRSLRLTTSAVQDLRNLPLDAKIPGHVIAPHPGPRHRSRGRYRGVPKEKRGTSGSGDARTGDGPV